MKDIVCPKDAQSLKLVVEKDSLCLNLPPYQDKLNLQIELDQKTSFQAFCLHLQNPNDAFLEPSYISSYSEVKPLSSMIVIKGKTDFLLYFCLSHKDQMISLSGNDQGLILHCLSGKSDESKKERPALLISRGVHLPQLIESAIELSLKITEGTGKLVKEKMPLTPWQETLGWESTCNFKELVSHENVLKAVSNLLESHCKVGFVLINDGWQETENGALKSFTADLSRFPAGLKGLIKDLNALGVAHVGVSHAVMGSPEGITKNLAKKYDLEKDQHGRYFLGSHLGHTFEFFHDYYTSLRQEGVTFIKLSHQSSPHQFVNKESDVTKVYKNLAEASQASASIQFNSALFNTDCVRGENIYHFATSSIARVANEMDGEDELSMMRTIRNSLVNAFWMQHLMLPDFATFQTKHKNSETLAILHALSGSVNMISDQPGGHDKHLIRKMVLPSGINLRADKPLTLCQESLFVDPLKTKTLYKAFTYKQGVGVLAAFNLLEENHQLHGFVSASDVEGLTGESFAVFSHHKGFIGCFKLNERIDITLKWGGADVFTFAPIKNGLAVLGCYQFFLTYGPIIEVTMEEDSLHIITQIATPILIYSEREILEVRRNGHTIPWEYDEKRKILSIDSRFQSFNEHSAYSVSFE